MQPGTMAPDIHGEVPCAICSRTMSNGGDPITPASPGNEDAKQNRKRHWCVPVCSVLGVIAFFTWALFIINYVLFPEADAIFVYCHLVKPPFFLHRLHDLRSFRLHYHARNIYVDTADNYTIRGWHILPSHHAVRVSAEEEAREELFDAMLADPSCSPRVLVYFHGTTATRGLGIRVEKYHYMASHLCAHVITIDYRGFGDSPGWPTESGIVEDARSTYAWVRKRLADMSRPLPLSANMTAMSSNGTCFNSRRTPPPACAAHWAGQQQEQQQQQRSQPHIYLYGHSLGSGVALKLAAELSAMGSPPSGVIIDAPFTNFSDALQVHVVGKPFLAMPILSGMVIKRVSRIWQSTRAIQDVACPMLIFHGKRDFILPVKFGRTLHQEALKTCQPVRFVELEHAGHNDIYRSPQWLVEMDQFFEDVEGGVLVGGERQLDDDGGGYTCSAAAEAGWKNGTQQLAEGAGLATAAY